VRVRVRLFASLREQAGWSERLVCPAQVPATPLGLWQQLQLAQVWAVAQAAGASAAIAATGLLHPAAVTPGEAAACPDQGGPPGPSAGVPPCLALPTGVRVAINQVFAAADTPLADGDELAFLPPISGG
jgi:sulfur-carrier protein